MACRAASTRLYKPQRIEEVLEDPIEGKKRLQTLVSNTAVTYALVQHVNQIHERGIVHNDLKEENVLWDSNTSTLTIIDFGGADTYPSYSNVGTNGYMAPDRLRTRASDVYSCGVIFLNLVML